MAGEEGDSPGCWAESRQGGVLTTGILTGLVKVGIISIHQTPCVLRALLGLSQPLGIFCFCLIGSSSKRPSQRLPCNPCVALSD